MALRVCSPARLLERLFAVLLLCCMSVHMASAQVVIGLSEMTALQCGLTLTNATCVQCPTVQNLTLPNNFFSSNVPCTRWAGFYDNSLAYMSQASSVALTFYFSDSEPPQCTSANAMFTVPIPSQNTCGTSTSLQYYIQSPFVNGIEQNPVAVGGALSCGWIAPGNQTSNSCPLENASSIYCPTVSNNYIAILGVNLTIFNLCPATCNPQYNSQCYTNFQQCNQTAMAVMPGNQLLGYQLMCGCAQALFACEQASGCYPTGAGLGFAYNAAAMYCGSNAPLTVNVGCSITNSTSTAAPTAATVAPVTVSCTSSDFGGSFGGAIFGTFLMHVITGLAIYARKRMGPQSVNVSTRPVSAEETGMVNKETN